MQRLYATSKAQRLKDSKAARPISYGETVGVFTHRVFPLNYVT